MKTWHVVAGLALVGFIAQSGGDLGGAVAGLKQENAIAVYQGEQDRQERVLRDELRRQSRVAMNRYKTGCKFVAHTATGDTTAPFHPGDTVTDIGISGRPPRDGSYICNERGDTAIVVNGTAQRPASVALDQMDEFQQLLQQIKQTKLNPEVPDAKLNQLPTAPVDPGVRGVERHGGDRVFRNPERATVAISSPVSRGNDARHPHHQQSVRSAVWGWGGDRLPRGQYPDAGRGVHLGGGSGYSDCPDVGESPILAPFIAQACGDLSRGAGRS